ncbi:hypothetical protein HXX76_015283 [Chlamydomonas incerta]|uniref:Vacuolar protein 8 n=1 Tax=Chlamydomonas incerta TaxID=51695 RepID=A0A835VS98_CHLIN|nr:hypothetical protein HXX76_015283 [Chlamydomonas incerta]|eukprot:KAG2423536.1 hypothetical protein HXX76_015283 [Chlamydomonas incerta]
MASCTHNVLTSLGSPSKQNAPRTHICSPTFRRERSLTATAALPFGFGAFGFGSQANAGAPGSPAHDGRGHRGGPEGLEGGGSAAGGPAITAASASVHSCTSPGSPHPAAVAGAAAPGGVRRRLSLPPLAAAAPSAVTAAPATPFFSGGDSDALLSDQHRVGGEGGSTHLGLMGVIVGSGTTIAGALHSKQQLHELLAEVDLRDLLPGLNPDLHASDPDAVLPHSPRGVTARQPHSPHGSASSSHRGVDLLREYRPSADLAQRRQRLLEALHSSLAAAPLGSTTAAVPLPLLGGGGGGGSGYGHWRRSELLAGSVLPRVVQFLTDELALAVPAAGGPGAAAVSAGLLPMRGITSSTAMALECLCTLFSEEMPELSAGAPACENWRAAVTTVVAVLAAARLPAATAWGSEYSYWIPSAPAPAPVATSPSAASAVNWGLLAGLASDSRVPPATAPSALSGAAGRGGGADCTADAAGWSPDVSAAFFAASALVRLARYPQLATAAVEGGAVEAVVRLMGSRPAMLAQMAVFAAYKLLRVPTAAPGAQLSSPQGSPARTGDDGGAATAVSGATAPGGGGSGGGGGREAALLAMAQAGGLGALCSCLRDLPDRPSRDMASSLMLDMALVPQVPAVVARLNQVLPLVSVLGDRRAEAATRMYALLVLARLANHSPECQMDAVREGAIEPLLVLVRRGSEEEQTHACRLLAILAQAVPTHGRFKELGVVQAVLPLLRGSHAPRGAHGVGADGGGGGGGGGGGSLPSSPGGSVHTPLVSEHAASVVAVLAQNPDMHFHVVGVGAVPSLVPLLSAGSEKARTYVLAALMLLCEGEERHAAVVVRAGALPTLVGLAGGMSALDGADGGSSCGLSSSSRHGAHAREFAAAVLCCMSRYVDMQEELLAHAAVPALVGCLAAGGVDAAVHAAEALVHLAGGEAVCKRMVSADTAAAAMVVSLLGADKPSARYWGLQLLRVISTDDTALGLLAGLSREQLSRYCGPSDSGSGLDEHVQGAGPSSRGSGGLRFRGGQLPFPWSGVEDAMPLGPPAPGSMIFGSGLMYGGLQQGDEGANAEAQRLLAGPLSVLLGPFASGFSTSPASAAQAAAAPSNSAEANTSSASMATGSGFAANCAPVPPDMAALEPVPSPPHGAKLVAALVRLLSWTDGGASWQQGRCRVLAAWLLARMCDYPPLAPVVLASGAVRELAGMLAEEQHRTAALAAAAAAAAAEATAAGELPESKAGELTIPLLPGEGEGLGLSESGGSGFHRSGTEMADGGAGGSMGLMGAGGPGMNARRARFDSNAAAASEAALLAMCRSLGWEGRQAVMAELAVRQWLGQSLRLSGL